MDMFLSILASTVPQTKAIHPQGYRTLLPASLLYTVNDENAGNSEVTSTL